MKPTEASSEFARTKTIKEQREYLPIYTVRDELMSVRGDGRAEYVWKWFSIGLTNMCALRAGVLYVAGDC
jgi:hypothetical protein